MTRLNDLKDLDKLPLGRGKTNVASFLKAVRDCTEEVVALRLEMVETRNEFHKGIMTDKDRAVQELKVSLFKATDNRMERIEHKLASLLDGGQSVPNDEIGPLRASFNGLTAILGTINRNVLAIRDGVDLPAPSASVKPRKRDFRREILKLASGQEMISYNGVKESLGTVPGKALDSLVKAGELERPVAGINNVYRITDKGREALHA